jgi:hypothetical protein
MPADVRQLFRLIDWLMELPAELQDGFRQELHKFEEDSSPVVKWGRSDVCCQNEITAITATPSLALGASREVPAEQPIGKSYW